LVLVDQSAENRASPDPALSGICGGLRWVWRAKLQRAMRPPCVADLHAALAAARVGRGRVALLSGGAGMGKTSVVRTFLAGLDAGACVLEGACDDLLTPRPFGPVHDISPWSGCRTVRASAARFSGCRRMIAMPNASVTNSVRMCPAIDQPTISRE
jgi:AAA ATPase domain